MPGRSPTWSACRGVRNTASRREKSSPASAKPDGAPRPQSMTKTRPSTTRAEQIPALPATGRGAPAVPSRTRSVVMLVSFPVRPAFDTSVVARPAWAGGGPRLSPPGQAAPVQGPAAQPVAGREQRPGPRGEEGAGAQRVGHHDVLAGRRRLRDAGSVQPDGHGGPGPRVVDGGSGPGGEHNGAFGSAPPPPPPPPAPPPAPAPGPTAQPGRPRPGRARTARPAPAATRPRPRARTGR